MPAFTLIIAGNNSSGIPQLAYSGDGLTYSSITQSILTSGNMTTVTNNGTFWIACAGFNYAKSSDGTTWTALTSPAISGNIGATQLTYGSSKFAACGYGNYNTATSPDGTTWTSYSQIFSETGGSAHQVSMIYNYGSTWVCGVTQSNSGITYGISLNNGASWAANASVFSLANIVCGVETNGTIWVSVGGQNVTTSPQIAYTTNPPSTWATSAGWTNVSGINLGGYGYGVKWNGTMFLAIGNATIATSTDGKNWTTSTNSLFSDMFSVNYVNGYWIIGQAYKSGSSVIITSPDAITWTASTSANTIFGNGGIVRTTSQIYPNPYPPTITSITGMPLGLQVNFTPPTYSGSSALIGYGYSINGGPPVFTNTTTSPINIKGLNPGTYSIQLLAQNSNYISDYSVSASGTAIPYPCFAKGSQILTADGYTPVQKLHPGDMIQTVRHGFVPIWKLGKKTIHHPASKDRLSHQLYRLSPDRYPALTEPLVITGCHSILVEEWSSDQEKERASHVHGGKIYLTDDRYRLPACADEKAEVHEPAGEYTIYHIALENEDYLMNYGIYANGLLVESCSKRYLAELSGMELLK